MKFITVTKFMNEIHGQPQHNVLLPVSRIIEIEVWPRDGNYNVEVRTKDTEYAWYVWGSYHSQEVADREMELLCNALNGEN